MNARPKEVPADVVLDLPRSEAVALHRAMVRAVGRSTTEGDQNDAKRLGVLRDALAVALGGGSFTEEVEP